MPGLRLNDALKNHTDFAETALSSATFVLAMNRQSYERLPRDLRTVIDSNSGQAAASMAGAMWDLDAKAVADAAHDRGEAITVLTAEEVAPWRTATEPVIAAWQKQMKGKKLDAGKLLAAVRLLLAKYADEPEPQAPQAPQASQPAEQKIVAEPQRPQPPQPTAEGFMRPKADAPAVQAAAPPSPAAPSPAASSAPSAPAAKPAPAPAAAPKPKELDIPL